MQTRRGVFERAPENNGPINRGYIYISLILSLGATVQAPRVNLKIAETARPTDGYFAREEGLTAGVGEE